MDEPRAIRRARGPVERARRGATWISVALAALGAASAVADPAAAPAHPATHFTISTGLDFSSGDYGQDSATRIWYVPLSLKVQRDPWVFRLTVPYIDITGPGNVVGGGGNSIVVVGKRSRRNESHDGIGDVIAGIGYLLAPLRPALPFLEFTVKAKFPTASSSQGLGTGAFDETLQVDASKSFGRLTPFATGGYRFIGEPQGFKLYNVAFASVGVDYRVGARLDFGLSYDWRQTASRFPGDAMDLSPYASWRLGPHLSVTPYAVLGLTRAAPDAEGGFQVSVRY